jgi:hypothetical protein
MDKQIENESISEDLLDGTEKIVVVLGGFDVAVTRADAAKIKADQQRREAERQRRASAAYHAIERYRQRPSQHHQKAALDAIQSCAFAESSEHCLLTVLHLIEFAPPAIFWPALMHLWDNCDNTWGHRARVLRAMKNARKPAWAFLSPSQHQFFETLPPLVRVFRGCSAPRVRAVAWTTDRAVAEDFARGHRGIRVPDPVVASAIIPEEHMFFVTDGREEKEIVLNPRRLRNIVVEPFAVQVERT